MLSLFSFQECTLADDLERLFEDQAAPPSDAAMAPPERLVLNDGERISFVEARLRLQRDRDARTVATVANGLHCHAAAALGGAHPLGCG
jgi:hypothetical protein